MQKKNEYKEFDQALRSRMADARENVPEGVWQAVESRLDSSSAITPFGYVRKPRTVTWRKVAAFAAAASICALALTGVLRRTSPTEVDALAENETVTEHTAPVVSAVEEIVSETSGPVFIADVTDVHPSSSSAYVSAGQASESEGTYGDSVSEAGQESVATPEEAPATQPSGDVPSSFRKEASERWDDPFARMEYEDSRSRSGNAGRVSFGLNGVVGANDSKSVSALKRSLSAAPGDGTVSAPEETGVMEKSESAFGIPLSLGIGIRYYLSDRVSLGTGVQYTLLARTFTGNYVEVDSNRAVTRSLTTDVFHNVHYLGVPLDVFYDMISSESLKFYCFGGGTVEKCLANRYNIYSSGKDDIVWKESVKPLQWSASLGLGAEYRFSKSFSLYLDPSWTYYFDCGQPTSVRTCRRSMFDVTIGLRFNL